jgi:Cu(I)/Ag(I) efflux system protein CusF
MNRLTPIVAVCLLAGCTAAPDAPAPVANANAPAPAATAPAPPSETRHASATGIVQAVDAAAHTLTIAHGPVEALGWPAMTMSFPAPGVDLSAIRPGDEVEFELSSKGMDNRIDSIVKK